ncbi:MAG TPA: lactate dehydrogenase, partial [Acidimicrobiaceae bacterium]|nr:lactate dehydrogenase [Acidimicrobiaceae bacterium]
MAAVTLDLIESTSHAALARHGCRDDIAADVARAVRVAEHN